MPGIIVGIDGSEHSRWALTWAMREAVSHRVPLTVVTVRPAQVRPATGVFWGVHDYAEDGQDLELTQRAVREFAVQVAKDTGETVPDITVNVETGDAAEELVRASQDADMLVVGSRGSGGFASLLMGSVSSQVTHHAACPVVVIPGPR
jgi:nucleotide-binding universal stress UspA family protein